MRRRFGCWLAALALLPNGLLADTLRGVVRDDRGQPVANARIDVATAAPKVGPGIFCPSCYLDCKKWTRTNREGQFEIPGLDPTLKFRILSTATGKRTQMTKLVDPATETVTLVLPDFPQNVPASRIVQGTVVTSHGTPIPGALIEPYGAKTKEKRWWGRVDAQATVSDDQGHFQMLLEDDFLGVDLTVIADGYAGTRAELLSPGHDHHEIHVPVGAAVTGQLVFQGKPIAGQQVAVVQKDRSTQRHFIKSVLAVTDGDGRFQISALPASQEYAIFSPVGGGHGERGRNPMSLVLSTKTFLMPDDDKSRDLGQLELQQGFTFSGRLERLDGIAVPVGTKLIFQRDPAWDLIEAVTQEEGRFALAGLPPETYEVVFRLKDVRIETGGLKFQTMSTNSFGVRLVKSVDDLVVPLVADVPESNANDVDSAIAERAEPDPPLEIPFVAPSVPAAVAGPQIVVRPTVRLTDEPVSEHGPTLSVRGTVVTASGERIRGATIILRAKINGQHYANGLRHNRDILAETNADQNGRFLLGGVPIPLRMRESITSLVLGRGGAEIVAFASGYAMTVVEVTSANDKTPLRVVLEKEVPIRGVVRDENGVGVSGVHVELHGWTSSTVTMDNLMSGPGDISFSLSQLDRVTLTGANGEFTIKHAPANRRVIVSCDGDGFKRQLIAIDTTPGLADAAISSLASMNRHLLVLSASPAITLERDASIQVRVVDQKNQPVQTGAVTISSNSRHSMRSMANSSGTVSLSNVSEGIGWVFYASEPMESGIGLSLKRTFKSGERFELRLPESRWLTGRVVSLATGEPIVGVLVSLHQDLAEPGDLRYSSSAVSRGNGEFRIAAMPGKQRLTISRELYGYADHELMAFHVGDHGMPIEIPEMGDVPEAIVKVSPGLIVEGVVVNVDGRPIAGALVRVDQLGQPFLSDAARTDERGTFRISGMSLGDKTVVNVSADGIGVRTVLDPPANADDKELRHEQVRLILKPGIQLAGRVLRGGKPQAGVKMELSRTMAGPFRSQLPFVTKVTDAEGRYVVGGLERGDGYEFKITTHDRLADPNWTHQSPYVRSIPDDASDVVELPDVHLMGMHQSISGQVVDPDGQPVAGITVSVQLKNGMSLSRRDNAPVPWADTDTQGAFRLEQLPDTELELMAYKGNPAGGRILNPVRIKATRNQSDVRMVLDPRLFEGVESLDAPPSGK